MDPINPLRGKRILIAEDEPLLAMIIVDDFVEHGAQVLGPFGKVAEVLTVIELGVEFDFAVLDINLLDGTVYSAADLLLSGSRPFVFASSVTKDDIPLQFRAIPLFSKPIEMRTFFAALGNG